jgi:hypothetical protein
VSARPQPGLSANIRKQMKTNESKIAFFYFHLFFRIGNFQRVTADSNKKKSFPLSHRGSNITTSHSSPGVRYWAGAQRGQQKYV